MTLHEFFRKVWHKIYYKVIAFHPKVDRFFRYQKPQAYWRSRGGEPYFQEQEAVRDRTLRSQFIAEEINRLEYKSMLEVGCGYGKQIKNFRWREAVVVGCDFSRPQLLKAYDYCGGPIARFVEADGEFLPFATKCFDLSLSSAVILHNDYEKARKMIAEMIRVTKKYLVHNEDVDVTFSRYGYDMKKTYEAMGFKIIKSVPIPSAPEPEKSQFTIVEIPDDSTIVPPDQIPLQYH